RIFACKGTRNIESMNHSNRVLKRSGKTTRDMSLVSLRKEAAVMSLWLLRMPMRETVLHQFGALPT
ncbi:MAG: hypothetical protein ABJ139_08495, partial [Paracoccaceae bacterium]